VIEKIAFVDRDDLLFFTRDLALTAKPNWAVGDRLQLRNPETGHVLYVRIVGGDVDKCELHVEPFLQKVGA